jgi:hypothetical protein
VKYKIETTGNPLTFAKHKHTEFWRTVKALEVGQSFATDLIDSNMRNGLTIAADLLGREYTSRREGGPDKKPIFRIYRVG